jgi:hypothetical protein
VLYPVGELVGHPLGRIGGESAAAVHRYLIVHLAEQVHKGHTEQPRLEIPQRHIHGGDGITDRTGPGGVARRAHHRCPTARHTEHIAADDHGGEQFVDQFGAGRRPVGPAGADDAT